MKKKSNPPTGERVVDEATYEVSYRMPVQVPQPAELCEVGYFGLLNAGYRMNLHLNNGKYPRIRKYGDKRPYVAARVLHEIFIGPVHKGDKVVPKDGNRFNLRLSNLVLRSRFEDQAYRDAVDALMAKHFAERDAVLKEQALMKRFRNR